MALERGAVTKPLDAVPIDLNGTPYYWSEEKR